MSAAEKLLDHKLLRSLSPLCDLSPDMLAELSAKSRVTQVAVGATIFKQGERDHRTLYLVAGKLELTDANGKTSILSANSKPARQRLDPITPHSITAIAKTPVSLLNIDTDLLEMLLSWGGKQQSYEVSNLATEDDDDTDWMSRFLQSKVFLKLRAENIQAMMMRMEEIPVLANEVIINQDDSDDNYYIIAKGKAKVARRVTPGAPLMKLAILGPGTGFGEEALISDSRRNASVTMMEGGTLMRLAKKDFIDLLVTPILQYLSFDEARAMQDLQWLDVRKLDEYSRGSLPGAHNFPLAEMRLRLRKLNKLHKYVVFSEGGSRAAAAVFLLNQCGLDAFVLRDGLDALSSSLVEKKPLPAPAPASEPVKAGQAVPTLKPEDNVVGLHGGSAAPAESDGRVEALMSKAKQRVQQEMQRAQAADAAREQAQSEVARLKAEAETARQQAEDEAHRAADQARSEAEREAAQKRADDLVAEQAEREAAVQRVEVETARAEQAMQAQKKAEEEIERLKLDAAAARRDMEAEARISADSAKKGAEEEIIRLKAEAEVARQRVEEQARLAADAARSEAERELAQQRATEISNHQQEVEDALQKAEIEAMRAQQAEAARQQAEDEAERMRVRAEETQREMEEQARLAADQARSEAERDAARQRAEDLAEQQEELEDAVGKAEAEAARAQAAESEVERLQQLAEDARLQAEEQARLAADQARSEAEREMSAQRAEEMARLQSEREQMASRAEDEAHRAKAADDARLQAEAEIQRLKVDAEVARMQLEEQAQRVADAARSDADREASRAEAAEEARLQAVNELERLEAETEQTRLEAEAQARLAVDAARSEAERAAASLRAEELAQQQLQLEEIARRAEEEAARAEEADAARQRAENEIVRRQHEAEAAAQRAEEEAGRAREAEAARQQMEDEMTQLRAEAAAAREQVEKQARLFAAAQQIEMEEAQKNNLAALDDERKQREAAEAAAKLQAQRQAQQRAQQQEAEALAERERLADAAAAHRKQEVEEAARQASDEARQAQRVAEQMRKEAEAEIKRLKAEAEASRLQAELEHKRSIVAAQRKVDQNKVKLAAQAKAKKAAAIQQRKKVDSEKARRARDARAAALKAIGKSEDGLDDFMELASAAAEIASDDVIVVNEAEIAERAKSRENLIDPREVMKVEKKEQKRQWVSDDFIWEATLGYRDDPDVESVGTPADSVGAPDSDEKKPGSATETRVDTVSTAGGETPEQRSAYEVQEINRTIRPQQDVAPRKTKRGLSVTWMLGAAVFLAAVAGGGWFYLSGDAAPEKLRAVVNQGAEKLTEITDKVTSTIGEIGKSEPDATAEVDGAEAKVKAAKDEETMARLRERLQSIKAEATQKAEAKPAPAPAPVVAVPATEALAVPEEIPPVEEAAVADGSLETVDDVMKALSQMTPDAGSAETDAPTAGAATVESVDGLPLVDESATAAGVEASVAADVETPVPGAEPAPETMPAKVEVDPAGVGSVIVEPAIVEPAIVEPAIVEPTTVGDDVKSDVAPSDPADGAAAPAAVVEPGSADPVAEPAVTP